jgi:hypothetical protein
MKYLSLAMIGVVAAACTPENGPLMRPGEDCLRCHGGSAGGTGGIDVEEATPWSFAGTVYPTVDADAGAGIEGVSVKVTDAAGFTVAVRTNLAGNFYSAERVAFPLRVCVTRSGSVQCMLGPAPHGACNFCHALPPVAPALGRIASVAQVGICPPGIQPTYSSIDQSLLKVSCIARHSGAQAASSGGLDCSGDAFSALVDVTAQNSQAQPGSRPPGLLRVKPGDPDNSLLYQKLVIGPTSPEFGEGRPDGGVPQPDGVAGDIGGAAPARARAGPSGAGPHPR